VSAPPDSADQTVPAHHHRKFACLGRGERELDRVLAAACPFDPELQPSLIELVLERRQHLLGAATA